MHARWLPPTQCASTTGALAAWQHTIWHVGHPAQNLTFIHVPYMFMRRVRVQFCVLRSSLALSALYGHRNALMHASNADR
jgi:hypothetical protein